MKPLVLFCLILVAVSAFSCRKPRYCSCASEFDSFIMDAGMTTKMQAEKRCNDFTIIYSPYYNCTLLD